ncbi:hypothetical protein [Botrimarina sp.]|uniref:hypothetical protein n=1 Tax=Botrimarina sp. TaxID=2795802 RepID=UPI0032EAF0A0
MTRYLRLGYLVPRLLLLVVLLLAAEIGSGWGLRWAAINAGQGAVGAKVEVGGSKVSLLGARAVLADVAVANPRRPMENLVEAERIELDFDSAALTHRSAVGRGLVRGLRFNTPRSESGALDPDDAPEAGGAAPAWVAGAQQAAADSAERWIAALESKLTGQVDEFESVRLAEQLSESWPSRWRELRAEAEAIEDEFRSLKEAAQEARRNPLRHTEFLATAPSRAAQLQTRLTALADEVSRLPELAEVDRQRIEAARKADRRLLTERLKADQLDPESLTSQLLGESVTGTVESLVGWVRWAREMTPASGPGERVCPRDRGADIRFVGVRPRPALLLTELQFDGVARLLGRGVELRGRVTDFCSTPAAHDQPLRIVAQATGGAPMTIDATLDRRQAEPIDTLAIVCEGFPTPGGKIGKPDKLAVRLAPTPATLAMNLRIEGEALSGRIDLTQHAVGLETIVGPDAGRVGARFGAALGQGLAEVDRAETTILVSGRLDRPMVKLESDLGGVLAAALQHAATDLVQAEVQQRFDAGQKRVDQQLARFDEQLREASRELSQRLAGPTEELERVAAAWAPAGFSGRGVSVEQIGRRLLGGGQTR